jgi:hypothetical protein
MIPFYTDLVQVTFLENLQENIVSFAVFDPYVIDGDISCYELLCDLQ